MPAHAQNKITITGLWWFSLTNTLTRSLNSFRTSEWVLCGTEKGGRPADLLWVAREWFSQQQGSESNQQYFDVQWCLADGGHMGVVNDPTPWITVNSLDSSACLWAHGSSLTWVGSVFLDTRILTWRGNWKHSSCMHDWSCDTCTYLSLYSGSFTYSANA